MNKVFVTWEEVETFIDQVGKYIWLNNKHYTGVYGVPRGGIVLATMLSYNLDIPLLLAPIKGCLIIDDIADTGKSLCHYRDTETNFNKYDIITMYYADWNSSVVPDLYFKLKEEDTWIVFPWEYDIDKGKA